MCFALWLLSLPWSLLSSLWDVSRLHLLLQGSLSGPSSPPGQLFHLPLFMAFPIPVGGEVAPSRTLCASLTHFTSSALGTLFILLSRTSFSGVLISSAVYRIISLAFYLLISHFTHVDFSISSLCLFPQSDLLWLFAHCAPLLSCCSVVFIGVCNAVQKSKGQASSSHLLENSSPDQDFRWWYLVVIFDFSVSFTEMEFCSYLLKK